MCIRDRMGAAPEMDEPPPANQPQPTDSAHSRLRWLLNSSRPPVTKSRSCAAAGLPIGVISACAIITGLAMNGAYTGDAWNGGSGDVPVSAESFEMRTADIELNVLRQGCACAGIASGMALVRFAIRNYTHPRVYGVFSFVSYLTLLVVMLGQVYGGTLTVLTSSQAISFLSLIHISEPTRLLSISYAVFCLKKKKKIAKKKEY
eukprot:TRINITY_DN27234_c0_g1_i1.p1 TRINITY_DN27234_c0_g1~~TRINITY_DN27234_c0_g1_i1.p1  ORF type:complete len:204 (+),score=59.80 TRINITY_DN27234_c0_g1_i1:180-791(+)